MPLSEYDTKEALRAATDWLVDGNFPAAPRLAKGLQIRFRLS